MESPREFVSTQYRIHPLVFLVSTVVVVLLFQMLTGNTYLMLLASSCWLIITLIAAFTVIGLMTPRFASLFLRKLDLDLPTVGLWFHPFLMTVLISLAAIGLLVVWPAYAGRGYWSSFLHLNPKVTTIAFTSTFFSFGTMVVLLVLHEIMRYLTWSVAIAEDLWRSTEGEATAAVASVAKGDVSAFQASLASFKEQFMQLEAVRQRAKHFNRVSSFFVFVALIVSGCWVVFFRPEVILFYRGEIQLRSFREPETAFETFEHLARKFPKYQYIDTVKFFAAWTLERRLGRYAEGARRYAEFLNEFGSDNVWADEIVASLVKLHLDKLHDPKTAIGWARRYNTQFPEGIMAPHVALYEVRALQELGRTAEALEALERAKKRFEGRQIELYDNEDNFASRIPFEAAMRGLDP